MKKLLLLLSAAILSLSSIAQDHHIIDSLQTLLKYAKDDTGKVNILNEFCLAKCDIDEYTDAKKYANDALLLAEKLDFKKGMATAYHILGVVHWNASDFKMALEYYQKALTINQDIDYKKGIAWDLGDIGLTYGALGDFPRELDYFLQALNINEQLKTQDAIAWNLRRIGVVYNSLSDFNKALEYFQKSLLLEEKIGNKRSIANNTLLIGQVYLSKRYYPEALKIFLDALNIAKETGNREIMSSVYNDIGDVHNALGNYSEALKNYFIAIKLLEEIEDKNNLGLTYSLIARIYIKENRYQAAREFLNKALMLSKETGSLLNFQSIYKGLAELESALGNYKKALEYKDRYYTYRDSLVNGESSKKIITMQMQNDFDKKEELDKADQEKKDIRQRNIRNSITGGLAGALMFLTVVYRQRNKIKKEKKRSEELLLNILPTETAEELKNTGTTKAKYFDEVTVLFTDFKNFTIMSEKLSAQELVNEINFCYSTFDNIITKYKIEKIKTIGDSYMCAGGLPVANKTNAEDTVKAALEIRDFMLKEKQKREALGKLFFEIRIGCNTGPVVAGIVGIKKFAYDIWGDTVNVASRMESSSEAGKVNISGITYGLVKDKFMCIHRGKIQAKNKGEIDMYFVEAKI